MKTFSNNASYFAGLESLDVLILRFISLRLVYDNITIKEDNVKEKQYFLIIKILNINVN